MHALLLVPLAVAFPGPTLFTAGRLPAATPEGRALAYLAREVPRWSPAHRCYSCHNNGDAARALARAVQLSYPLPPRTFDDTARWLARPEGWDHNGGEGEASDRGLARIQFAAALVDAVDAGLVKEPRALERAAALVAEGQQIDGRWKPDGPETLGSPATYGTALATAQARRVLVRVNDPRHRDPIARADRWLRKIEVRSVLDAAAVLIALEESDDADARKQRQRCLELIRQGQARDGGWGPYLKAPPEPFDTALVLLALAMQRDDADLRERVRRGRAFLVALQRADGSWEETTRPAGATSYAQRVSTSGWATLALLATRPR